METFINTFNRKVEAPLRDHLKNVYLTMAMALMTASIGSYVHLYTNILSGGLLSFLMSLGFGLALIATPDTGKNRGTRLLYLNGFAFSGGLNLGPLLEVAIFINPQLITTALLSTCLIFGCFSLSTIFGDQRKWIYLGGTLFSGISLLMMMSLMNLFIGSRIMYEVQMYISFVIICGFIMYDTSIILEKRRMGDDDYIWHSLLLFIDFVDVFRHLLVFLMQKESNKNRRKK